LEKGNMPTDWTPAPEDTDSSIASVQNNLDNLQIGGANLLYHSDLKEENPGRNYAFSGLNDSDQFGFEDEAYHFTTPSDRGHPMGNGRGIRFRANDVGVKTGESLVFSVDIKGTLGTNGKMSSMYSKDGIEGYWSNQVELADLSDLSASEYKRYHGVFTFPEITDSSGGTNGMAWYFCIFILLGYGGEVWFKNLKLERGTKPTDWTPAPEDYDVKIENINNEIENIDNKIEGINNEIENIDSEFEDINKSIEDLETNKVTIQDGYGLLSDKDQTKLNEIPSPDTIAVKT
jgi:hypothetical protein